MKIDEVTEAPRSGAIAGMASKAMSKLPGGKAKAQDLATRADVADTAKNLYKEFKGHLSTQNRTVKQATGRDVANFLAAKNHKLAGAKAERLDQKELGRILSLVAKNEMEGKNVTNIGQGAKQKIPAAIYQAIQQLSPEQRQALRDLL